MEPTTLIKYLESKRELYFSQLVILQVDHKCSINSYQIQGGIDDGKTIISRSDVDGVPNVMMDKLSRIDFIENMLADMGVDKWVELRDSLPSSEVK